ncbi:MAG: tRNA lysidine(34) synthetase TilS, partial [Chloroflexota bacterium]
WRKDIEAYCETHKLDTVEDLTNLDQTYFRNRLRHSLIPTMETYNPGFKQALLRSAESLRGDFQLLSEVVDDFWESSLLEIGEGFLVFNLSVLQAASPAILRNLFRRSATYLNSDLRDVGFDAVERLVRYTKNEASVSREIDFTDGNHVFIEDDRLFVARRSANIPFQDWPQIEQPMELKVGQPLFLNSHWHLLVKEVESLEDLGSIYTNSDPFQAWMDADLIRGDLQVRSRKDGDRFQPLGIQAGRIKLSDYFINEKLPVRGRKTWPLVCLENEILWIPGYRSAHPYRVTDSTRRLLHFELTQTSS